MEQNCNNCNTQIYTQTNAIFEIIKFGLLALFTVIVGAYLLIVHFLTFIDRFFSLIRRMPNRPYYLRIFYQNTMPKNKKLNKIKEVREIDKIYFRNALPLIKREFLISTLILTFLIIAFIVPCYNNVHLSPNVIVIIVAIICIIGYFDIKKRMYPHIFSLLEKSVFVNFIYDLYKKYPEYAENIVYYLINNNKYKNFYEGKAVTATSQKEYIKLKNLYNEYKQTQQFPKEKEKLIETLFAILINNFQEGIDAIKKAEKLGRYIPN